MDLGSFLTFLKLFPRVEADLEKKTITIKAGPFTLRIPYGTYKALMSKRSTVVDILSRLFIQRGVMWEDFRREKMDECITSLREIQKLAQEEHNKLKETNAKQDEYFASIMFAWANVCEQAVTELGQALETENDPVETGIDFGAGDFLAPVLLECRKSTYPLVDLLICLLPDDDPVRQQASEKLALGKNRTVQKLGARIEELPGAELRI